MIHNYEQSDLKNRSFRGQRLQGAVFRNADIRGADFTGADLKNADLSNAQIGMTPSWRWTFFGLALLVSLFFGVLSGWTGDRIQQMINGEDIRLRLAGFFVAIETILFLAIALAGGFRKAFRYVARPAIFLALLLGAAAIILRQGTGIGSLAAITGILVSISVIVIGTLARTLAGTFGPIMFAAVAISGGVAANQAGGGLLVVIVALSSVIISKRALAGHSPYFSIAQKTLDLALSKGTRFNRADLSGASFKGDKLSYSDFSGAKVYKTRWDGANVLSTCRFDKKTPTPTAGA